MKSRKRIARKRALIRWVIGVPAVALALILIILVCEKDGEGIPKALVAKSVALALKSPKELEDWRTENKISHFPAKSLGQWYVPYMDYLYDNGYFSEEETPAEEAYAEEMLTYGEAARIARAFSPSLEDRVGATKGNQNRHYPEEMWWLLYDSLLKEADPDGNVEKRTVCIYGTPENVPGTLPWTAHTNLGQVGFSGLALDGYMDHQLSVYLRGGEILHVLEDQGGEVVYRNVWLLDGDESGLQVYVGDIERRLPFAQKSKGTEGYIHNLADIRLEDGKVTKVSVKKERLTGKLLSVQPDAVELEGYGMVPLDEECKILKAYGEMERQELSDVLVGYDIQEFVVAKGKVCAVLTVREFDPKTIRVLVMNENFEDIYHDVVTLSGDAPLTLAQGEQAWEVAAGEEVVFSPGDERLSAGRVIVTAAGGGEIRVCSMERSQGQPCYGGRLELVETGEGLVMVNELYLEDYLKKVIPSEMPPSYEQEALKAQAVCARTYAYMQIQSNTYSQYGAHVDDSTKFQVYNNQSSDGRTAEAVEKTYGKMLLYGGEPITTYYFSTSCGITTDNGVWGGDPEKTPYLISATLQPGRKALNLTDNGDFAAFIKKADYPSYDASFPYYRWTATTNANVLTANMGGIGQVEDIQVVERGAGGVAKKLLVKGTEGEKTISGQDRIRSVLWDASLTIYRNDGSKASGWRSLPSGFIAIEDAGKNDQGVRQFKIYGGGYGHGVGMSQNGAQGMAKEGATYEEILKFFYEGVAVEELKP